MLEFQPTKDKRTTYDEKTGAVRSFFGAELVGPLPEDKRDLSPTGKADLFLEANSEHFKLAAITFGNPKESQGAASMSVRYEQQQHGIPVYRAQVVVGLRKEDGVIASTVNTLDYEIPSTLTRDKVEVGDQQVVTAVRERFKSDFENLKMGRPTLYVYRHVADESVDLDLSLPPIRDKMLRLSTGTPGQVYLVWQVLMQTEEPNGSWELLVDATNGKLVAVKDRRRYAPPRAHIFWPDPVRSSMDSTLNWSTLESTLNAQLVEVSPDSIDESPPGTYRLNGPRVRCVDKTAPNVVPLETAGDFIYGAKDPQIYSVMAYYYLDRLIKDLRDYGITDFTNATEVPIEVDAQGCEGLDQSYFHADDPKDPDDTPYIEFGTGPGVPDAQDPGVIAHEYGHAIHHFLEKHQSYDREHWFCDFLAVAWVDRYNKTQYVREEMFPWDNNSADEWSTYRRVDLTARFDDQAYAAYKLGFRGAIGATALWDWFKSIGGDSSNADERKWAADEAIRTYMDMLIYAAEFTSQENLANGLIEADKSRTGGLYKKVIWDAFRRRGLWSEFTQTGNVDMYIRAYADTGTYESPQIDWTSPDIWVRNNPPSPSADQNQAESHQPPINNMLNYVYVRVRNRGSQEAAANTFSVEVFRCSPATAMIWPADFDSLGTKLILTTAVPADGGSVCIGPFEWIPDIEDQECLLAVVKGPTDPTIADSVKAVDHLKLVRFDNNVAKRNVEPAVP